MVDASKARRGLTRRFLPRPRLARQLQQWVGRTVPIDPAVFSTIKLLIVTPALVSALAPVAVLPSRRSLVLGLLVAFLVLDYLEAAVAHGKGLEPRWARVLDRVSDYPLLVAVAFLAVPKIEAPLLLAKVTLDVLLLVLYVAGRGRTENRLRTSISYASLIALVWVVQGWGGRVLNPVTVSYLLWVNIAFSATTAAYQFGLLQKRFVADALSAANLLCGVFSIVFASRGRFEISLLFVLLGTAFDGFDGAAARRWGGTRIGVYSDDVADGVNYGVAPGVALYFVLGGWSGAVVGVFYTTFTIARLVFFTLNKAESDPNYFAGVPSPVGGLIAMASIVVFEDAPGILGLLIGVACAQMVSFSTHYRHLGRAIAKHRRALVGAPLYLVVLLLGMRFWGAKGGAAVILAGNLVYGFLPTFLAFARVLSVRRASRANPTSGAPDDDADEQEPASDAEVPLAHAALADAPPPV